MSPTEAAASTGSNATAIGGELGSAFVARQPIVDRDQQLVAYELFFRGSSVTDRADIDTEAHADSQVLINTVSNFGTDWVLGGKLAFINASAETFRAEYIELVHPDKMVLEIQPSMLAAGGTVEAIERWRAAGYRFAVGTYALHPDHRRLLSLAQYLKLDVQRLGSAGIAKALVLARRIPGLKVVAEKVEARADFVQCRDLGVDLFQGYFFARPETLAAKVVNPSYATVVRLLNMVRRDPDVAEIEQLIKHDPALSFKLVRYINSAGFALSCEITSFRHAVMILGFQKLYRWLTLLLAAGNHQGITPALARTAVARGRLVELLSSHYLDGEERDNAFVVGLFSLLDVMLDMPMERILDTLPLPEPIADAIVSRQGIYAPFLELAVACERRDPSTFARCADAVQLTAQQVNQAHLSALRWTEDLGM